MYVAVTVQTNIDSHQLDYHDLALMMCIGSGQMTIQCTLKFINFWIFKIAIIFIVSFRIGFVLANEDSVNTENTTSNCLSFLKNRSLNEAFQEEFEFSSPITKDYISSLLTLTQTTQLTRYQPEAGVFKKTVFSLSGESVNSNLSSWWLLWTDDISNYIRHNFEDIFSDNSRIKSKVVYLYYYLLKNADPEISDQDILKIAIFLFSEAKNETGAQNGNPSSLSLQDIQTLLQLLKTVLDSSEYSKLIQIYSENIFNHISNAFKYSNAIIHDRWALEFSLLLANQNPDLKLDSLVSEYHLKYNSLEDVKFILNFIKTIKRFNLKVFVEKELFRQLPNPQMIHEILDTAQAIFPIEIYKFTLEAAYQRYVLSKKFLRQDVRRKYESEFAQFKQKKIIDLANAIDSTSDFGGLSNVSQILHHQNELNQVLKDRLDSYIEANAPPKGVLDWHGLILKIPQTEVYTFVIKLLKKNGSSATSLSNVISKLEPINGVREAVVDFLSQSSLMDGNRSQFSHEQIQKMFKGSRFSKFFPHIFPGADVDSGAVRTKFIIAVRTSRNNRLSTDWLREKITDSEVSSGPPSVIGYRPALSFVRLTSQLEGKFSGDQLSRTNPRRQARGLIVQGFYEKQGFTLMERLTGRGDAQVEVQANTFMGHLERSLRTGALSQDSSFIQRQFVYQWAISSSSSLIERIRNRAAWIADKNSRFWGLRVEIHNFPNHEILSRTKMFLENYKPNNQVKAELETLVLDIEKLLGVDKNKKNLVMDDLLEMLPANEGQETLKEISQNFDKEDVLSKLETLSLIRSRWFEINSDSGSSLKSVERYLGDRLLSDQVQVVISEAINDISVVNTDEELDNFIKLVILIFDHIQKDDLLSAEQVSSYLTEIHKIFNERTASVKQKTEMILSLIQNSVDQVFYMLVENFGKQDEIQAHITNRRDGLQLTPIRFVDGALRSSNVFQLSKLIDHLYSLQVAEKNLSHTVGSAEFRHNVEVYNSGYAVGILRLNKNPLELSSDEIGVFESLPAQASPMAGIITLGAGARLSHLQLLAKSLKIPNAKLDRAFLKSLTDLDGKRVLFSASEDGRVEILEYSAEAIEYTNADSLGFNVPIAQHRIKSPLTFTQAGELTHGQFAGPKGLQLSKMFVDPSLHPYIPDGVILPFGFFEKYARATGIWKLIKVLRYIGLKNTFLIAQISGHIRQQIRSHPIPEQFLNEVFSAVEDLKIRSEATHGFFVRSDTNIEDLPHFNGAGLNESVPNVSLDRLALDQAIRTVWGSPFSERSIFWRALALKEQTVTNAEPSVVIMPTVKAESSGVILSRGTKDWVLGKGMISANWGIGSVVEASSPVEEISLSGEIPQRSSFTVSTSKPVANDSGGLRSESVKAGEPVLNNLQIQQLNEVAQIVDSTLGDQPHGWDIEWAIDELGQVIILQARPNM